MVHLHKHVGFLLPTVNVCLGFFLNITQQVSKFAYSEKFLNRDQNYAPVQKFAHPQDITKINLDGRKVLICINAGHLHKTDLIIYYNI